MSKHKLEIGICEKNDDGCTDAHHIKGSTLCVNCINPQQSSKKHREKCGYCWQWIKDHRTPSIGQHYCLFLKENGYRCHIPANDFWGGKGGIVPKKYCYKHDDDEKKANTFCIVCMNDGSWYPTFRQVLDGFDVCVECKCLHEGCHHGKAGNKQFCVDHIPR